MGWCSVYDHELLPGRIASKIYLEPNTGCWLWTGCRTSEGYGNVRFGGPMVSLHRLAYTLLVGPIPPGTIACHSCDTPPCCNPAHIFIGTHRDNGLDKERKKRGNHPFGSDHGRSKLTEAQVIEIRFLFASGKKTRYELCDMYGVKRGCIDKINSRRNWRSVP